MKWSRLEGKTNWKQIEHSKPRSLSLSSDPPSETGALPVGEDRAEELAFEMASSASRRGPTAAPRRLRRDPDLAVSEVSFSPLSLSAKDEVVVDDGEFVSEARTLGGGAGGSGLR